jgi:hypothetical protein
LNKDIIEQIKFFHESLSNNYTVCLDEIKVIACKVNEARLGFDKIRNKYFEACATVEDQEKLVCKSFSGKIITSDEEINNVHDVLLKYNSQADNYAQLYKYEINKFNRILDECEKKYFNLIERLKINEEGRIFFMKSAFERYVKLCEDFTISTFDFFNVAFVNFRGLMQIWRKSIPKLI